jgi:cysteinyl-tRNA synthetase
MNYVKENTMQEVSMKEKNISEFLIKSKGLLANSDILNKESWNPEDTKLHNEFLKLQEDVDYHLKNNFDTKSAIETLLKIVTAANTYFTYPERKALLISKIKDYIVHMLSIFGLDFGSSGGSAAEGVTVEDIARPYVKAASEFRKKVREGGKKKEGPGYFLSACDIFRDEVMPNLGIKIVDDQSFDFFFVDKDTLLAEIEAKKQQKNAPKQAASKPPPQKNKGKQNN